MSSEAQVDRLPWRGHQQMDAERSSAQPAIRGSTKKYRAGVRTAAGWESWSAPTRRLAPVPASLVLLDLRSRRSRRRPSSLCRVAPGWRTLALPSTPVSGRILGPTWTCTMPRSQDEVHVGGRQGGRDPKSHLCRYLIAGERKALASATPPHPGLPSILLLSRPSLSLFLPSFPPVGLFLTFSLSFISSAACSLLFQPVASFDRSFASLIHPASLKDRTSLLVTTPAGRADSFRSFDLKACHCFLDRGYRFENRSPLHLLESPRNDLAES